MKVVTNFARLAEMLQDEAGPSVQTERGCGDRDI